MPVNFWRFMPFTKRCKILVYGGEICRIRKLELGSES